jgi:ORF6N domain-containing protein
MGEGRRRSIDEPLEPLIFKARDQRVILDADLARIYGLPTRSLNQAVKRNAGRFPIDFAFQLTAEELANLKSQFVTSSLIPAADQRLARSHGGRRRLPTVFTEHGALMAANIVRSERAVQMSIYVIRAFVRLREHVASNAAVLRRLAEIDKTLLQHDAALRDVFRRLQSLLAPPPELPKRRIGF